MTGAAEAVLRRHRGVTIAGLIAVAALAWTWIASGAGMGMNMAMAWDAERVLLTLAMWWVMMIAMMVPATAPTVLLYAKSAQKPHSGAFLFGYLLCWLGFSILAVALHFGLESAGRMGAMEMALPSPWLAGSVLIAAGLYQFTPLKSACLAHCRSPAHWLSRNFRPGSAGALRMGLSHGAFCLGCCWMLMLLLFVVGVMNLVWIAALTLLVAAEKLLPGGQWIARRRRRRTDRLGRGVASLTPDQFSADQHPPNLVGAGADVEQLGVAVIALDRPVLGVAGAAQGLDRLVGDLHRVFGGQQDRAGRVEPRGLARVARLGDLVDVGARVN